MGGVRAKTSGQLEWNESMADCERYLPIILDLAHPVTPSRPEQGQARLTASK